MMIVLNRSTQKTWENFVIVSGTKSELIITKSITILYLPTFSDRREIFILGVLGFLKTTRSFPKISEDVRSLPKKSEVFRRRINAYKRELAPSAFHFKNQRSRGRYCHLFILHMVFVPYMGLS